MVRNQHDQALHGARIVGAVMDAARASHAQVRDSGALIRYRSCTTVEGTRLAVVEVIHRFLLPALDEQALASDLGLRVTRSDDVVLRLEA